MGAGQMQKYDKENDSSLVNRHLPPKICEVVEATNTKLDEDLYTQSEIELHEQQWNEFDPNWRNTWTEFKCDMVLNYPTTSKKYEIDTAKMYRKYWKSIKHFNQKNEQALIGPLPLVSQQSNNNKKRKHDEMESTNANS